MLSINAQVEDEETERLLTYLEDRLGKNRMDQLDLLSCARQWLELEVPTSPARNNRLSRWRGIAKTFQPFLRFLKRLLYSLRSDRLF